MMHRMYIWLGWATVFGLFAWGGMILIITGLPQVLMSHMEDISVRVGCVVREVEVVGRIHTDLHDLRAALHIEASAPLLSLDLAAARTRVEALPWVDTVRVERGWPDRVYVALTEHDAVARWAEDIIQPAVLIDVQGSVLMRGNLAPFVKLPLIVGLKAPQALPDLMALLETQPAIMQRLSWAHYIGARRWDLILSTGMRLKLPAQDPALALARLVDKAPYLLDRPAILDLRFEKRIIVKLLYFPTKREEKSVSSFP